MIAKIPTNTNTFKYYNANPKDKRACDCVIRAIATATGKSWDDVLDDLIVIAHKYKYMPDEPKCYGRYLESLGFTKRKQPRKYDNTKYTGSEFCELIDICQHSGWNEFTIVAHIGGHHIVAIKLDDDDQYKVHDTWNSTHGTIGNYWIKKEEN